MAGQNPQQNQQPDPKEVARQKRYEKAKEMGMDIGNVTGPDGKEVKNPLLDIGVNPETLGGIASNIENIKWGSAQLYSGIAGKNKKSIIGMARANVFEFPVFISDSVPMKFATATNTLLEQVYAAWLQMAISVNPIIPYEQYKAAGGSPFAAYKTDVSKYLECVDLSFQKDSCHKKIVNKEEGITMEFDMISIPDNVAKVINEAVDYQPLSEFDHYFTEATKPNKPSNPNGGGRGGRGQGGQGNSGNQTPPLDKIKIPKFNSDGNPIPIMDKNNIPTGNYEMMEVELRSVRDINTALQALQKLKDYQFSNETINVSMTDTPEERTSQQIDREISKLELQKKRLEDAVIGGDSSATGDDEKYKKKTSPELQRSQEEIKTADMEATRAAKRKKQEIDKRNDGKLDSYDIDEEIKRERLRQARRDTDEADERAQKIGVEVWNGKRFITKQMSDAEIRKKYNAAQLERMQHEASELKGQKERICRLVATDAHLRKLFGVEYDQTMFRPKLNKDNKQIIKNGKPEYEYDYDAIYSKILGKTMLDEALIQDVKSKQLQRELQAATEFVEKFGVTPEFARELREVSREEREERRLNYELNATKAPQFIDENKIKKLNSLKPLMMVVNMHIMAKDGHVSHPMEYVVGVRTHCRLVKSSILPEVVEYPTKEMNKIARKAKWRAGELKFFRDIVFHIKEKKQTAIDSRDPNRKWYRRLYELAHMKGDGNVSKKISGSGYTHGLIPCATIVISKADVDNIEEATGIDVLKASVARGLCESLFLMNFVVVDIDAESIKILSPDINNDFDVQSLDSVNKQIAELSTAGKSVMDIFKALK